MQHFAGPKFKYVVQRADATRDSLPLGLGKRRPAHQSLWRRRERQTLSERICTTTELRRDRQHCRLENGDAKSTWSHQCRRRSMQPRVAWQRATITTNHRTTRALDRECASTSADRARSATPCCGCRQFGKIHARTQAHSAHHVRQGRRDSPAPPRRKAGINKYVTWSRARACAGSPVEDWFSKEAEDGFMQ